MSHAKGWLFLLSNRRSALLLRSKGAKLLVLETCDVCDGTLLVEELPVLGVSADESPWLTLRPTIMTAFWLYLHVSMISGHLASRATTHCKTGLVFNNDRISSSTCALRAAW